MLKLDGILRADTPALTAAGAFGHIVFECPLTVVILKTQCRCRAIFNASQTAIAALVNPKVRHKFTLIYYCNLLILYLKTWGSGLKYWKVYIP
jgi:hypothetical protein